MSEPFDEISIEKILRMLEELPEKWSADEREKKIKIIAERKDATWVSGRIYEDVDRGLILARIETKKAKHSVEMDIVMKGVEVVGTAALATAMSLLLEDIKRRIVRKWKTRLRKRRMDNADDYF